MANTVRSYRRISAALTAGNVPHIVKFWQGEELKILDEVIPENPNMDFSKLIPDGITDIVSTDVNSTINERVFEWTLNLRGITNVVLSQKFYFNDGKLISKMRIFYGVRSRSKLKCGIEIMIAPVSVPNNTVRPLLPVPQSLLADAIPLEEPTAAADTLLPDETNAENSAQTVNDAEPAQTSQATAVYVPSQISMDSTITRTLLMRNLVKFGSAAPRAVGRIGTELQASVTAKVPSTLLIGKEQTKPLEVKQLRDSLGYALRDFTRQDHRETTIEGGVRHWWRFAYVGSSVIVEQDIVTRDMKSFTTVRVGVPGPPEVAFEFDFGTQQLDWCSPMFPTDFDRGIYIGPLKP